VQAHQNLAGTGPRVRHRFESENFGTAELMDANGFHDPSRGREPRRAHHGPDRRCGQAWFRAVAFNRFRRMMNAIA
jgi:hypothetical protein